MKKKLMLDGFIKFFAGVLLIGLLLFLPAGTLQYWNGWLFCAVLFVPVLLMGIVLFCKNPDLLRKRLAEKEPSKEQGTVVKLSGLMFLAGFVVAGLDFRFKWLPLPIWVPIAAAVLFLAGYGLFAEVTRENAYLSRIVEVQEGQKVVDTGLYGAVRHPMYSATLLMFLAMPLVLGSLISFAVFLCYPLILVKRIRSEEAILEEGLEGYKEYKKRVKYRLIPFLW